MKHELGGSKKSRRQKEAAQNPEMGQDFFTNLPSEIIINILSRLPVPAAMSCKCVCKPLLDLLATPEFVKSHLSKSVPGLAVFESGTLLRPYKIFEFVDELDLNRDVRPWTVVFNFDFPYNEPVHSSANGLLFLCKRDFIPFPLFVCNPVTRDYIALPCPHESSSDPQHQMDTYGFGVSRMSGQYKLVRIFCKFNIETPHLVNLDKSECQVYTVGTGSWRTIASGSPRMYQYDCTVGAFLNGNLHWLVVVRDLKGASLRISCFDLETDLISTFSISPVPLHDREGHRNLSALGDTLCLCDNSADEIFIWLMKEYGDEKSWTKEFIFRKMHVGDFNGVLWPVKVFKDGDILMELGSCSKLLYYSNKTETIHEVYVPRLVWDFLYSAAIYTPSFLPLKTFAMENVRSF